jgi:hypothetical protein
MQLKMKEINPNPVHLRGGIISCPPTRWTRLLSNFLLLLVLVGCCGVVRAQKQDNLTLKAEEEAQDYKWDFGKVKEGEVLKHNFVLKNKTNKDLTIEKINTSCGCTVSKVKKKKLSPQKSTIVEVKFNTKGYSGTTTQFIYVNTNDLDKPVIRFIITAQVVK